MDENDRLLIAQARALLDGERDYIANAANMSALLFTALCDINWVGFYFLRDGELVVGPFGGQPACTRIAIGRGVCGSAVERNETLRVADVHAFDGHIACDPLSRSEIVVPLRRDREVFGVLDVDSPLPDRFSADDQALIEALAAVYVDSL